jgi:hypothetical protein
MEHLNIPGGYLNIENSKVRRAMRIHPSKVCPRGHRCPYYETERRKYVFEGQVHGHISTRQIQRLLEKAAETARLKEMLQAT